MIEILSTFAFDVLTGVTATKVTDLFNKNDEAKMKRVALARLVDLYDSLADLINSSYRATDEFLAYAEGRDTVTKTIPSRFLNSINACSKKFDENLRKVHLALRISDRNLSAYLKQGSREKASSVQESFRVLECIAPRMIDGTFTMEIPSSLPRLDDFRDGQVAEAERLRYVEALNRSKVDLKDSQDLLRVLKNSKVAIERLEEAEKLLGDFIAQNFSFAEVLRQRAA